MKTPGLTELTALEMEAISGGLQVAPRGGRGGLLILLLLVLLLGRNRPIGGGVIGADRA